MYLRLVAAATILLASIAQAGEFPAWAFRKGNTSGVIVPSFHVNPMADRALAIRYRRALKSLALSSRAVMLERNAAAKPTREYTGVNLDAPRLVAARARVPSISDDAPAWLVAMVLSQQRAMRISAASVISATETEVKAIVARELRPIDWLEDAEVVLLAFESLPANDQLMLVDKALVSDDQYASSLRNVINRYIERDLEGMCSQLIAGPTTAYWAKLVDDRNADWIHTITKNEASPLMIVVGAAHTCGPKSLQQKLVDFGYHIEPILF